MPSSKAVEADALLGYVRCKSSPSAKKEQDLPAPLRESVKCLKGGTVYQRVPKGALFLYAIKEGIPMDLIVRKIPQSDTIKVYPVSDVHLGSIARYPVTT